MKATKYLFFIVIASLLWQCDSDDNRTFTNASGQFVRFNLQLDRNNQPIEYPTIEPGIPAVSLFNKQDVNTIKIPVALTSQPLADVVTINYEAISNGINNIQITPSTLTFQGTQLIDTLFVSFNERWDPAITPSLRLTLTDSSNPAINIGMPNNEQPLNELLINFADFELNYGISSNSRVDIVGTNSETHDITISFPNGYIASEVSGINLLQETQSNFNYTLDQLPLTESRAITYRLTIDQDFTDNDLLYKTSFALSNIPGYILDGNPSVSLIRDPITPRDLSLTIARSFWDTPSAFDRTFAVTWFDDNFNGICEWEDSNAFVVPVIVPQDDPNAVLGNDMGTPDPSDDIYHHAFRIGFVSSNSNVTTNPFNLKRWFTNEGSNASTSPGFNIEQALEFYPDNGTSATSGTVQVIEQTLQIGTTATNGSITEFITISGSGTYTEISPGIFDIDLTFNATNNRLFGGTRTSRNHLYNTNSFTDPPLLTEPCFTPVAL